MVFGGLRPKHEVLEEHHDDIILEYLDLDDFTVRNQDLKDRKV